MTDINERISEQLRLTNWDRFNAEAELAEERRNQRCLKDALRDIASADNGHRCKCQCANNLIEHAQEAIIVSDGNPKVTLTDEQKDRLWSQIKCNLKTREEAENKISATEAERDGADKLALHWKAKFEAARGGWADHISDGIDDDAALKCVDGWIEERIAMEKTK